MDKQRRVAKAACTAYSPCWPSIGSHKTHVIIIVVTVVIVMILEGDNLLAAVASLAAAITATTQLAQLTKVSTAECGC